MSQPNNSTPAPNYKGILLSNRPAGVNPSSASQTGKKVGTPNGPLPFMPSGMVRDNAHIGLPPPNEINSQHASAKHHLAQKQKYAPQASVTYQHKQYLRELQGRKRQERDHEMQREEKDAEKRAKFQESQRQLRQMMRDANYSESDIKIFLKTGKMSQKGETGAALGATSPIASPSSNTKKKPAWLTEHSKNKQRKVDDSSLHNLNLDNLNNDNLLGTPEDELDDLLDFANNLDFDDFIDDFEVREALAVIHSRVKEMEDELTEEEKEERERQRKQRIEEARQRGAQLRNAGAGSAVGGMSLRMAQHENDWDSSTRVDANGQNRSGTNNLDTNLLKRDEHLKQIHSKASLGTVTQNVATKPAPVPKPLTVQEAEQEIERLMETVHRERAQRGVVVTHSARNARGEPNQIQEIAAQIAPGAQVSAEDRSRILTKLRKDPTFVQNLPYMYRCPSI